MVGEEVEGGFVVWWDPAVSGEAEGVCAVDHTLWEVENG